MLFLFQEVSYVINVISISRSKLCDQCYFYFSMLRLLLFHAKMKFVKAVDQEKLALCDIYMARVDLLDLLVSNNCSHIPTVQQLIRLDSLR